MKLKPGTYLREPCVVIREGGREASVAVRVARDIEHRKRHYLGRRGFPLCRRQHVRPRYGERADRPTVSETPWTHASILSGPGRSLHYLPLRGRSPKRRLNADRRTYGGEKSDATIQCAGQRPDQVGSNPTGARIGGAISKDGTPYHFVKYEARKKCHSNRKKAQAPSRFLETANDVSLHV